MGLMNRYSEAWHELCDVWQLLVWQYKVYIREELGKWLEKWSRKPK